MGTARSTNEPTPRKRVPRKATAKKAPGQPVTIPTSTEPKVVDTPGPRPADTPPAVAPSGKSEERVARLRAMLIEEGIDPDTVLATTMAPTPEPATTMAPTSEPATTAPVEGEVIDKTTTIVDGIPDEPIPGVTLAGIRKIIVDARQNPETADIVVDGVRGLIESNGYDPDKVIALAFGSDPGGSPGTNVNGLANAIVEFKGRMIEVTAPEIEQVMVIRRMQSLFANAAKMETITADEAVRLMDRALKAVCSVVVKPEDVEYLEDLLLTKQASIEDTLPLLRRSLQALEDANTATGNRAQRRKAAKSAGRTGGAALVTATE